MIKVEKLLVQWEQAKTQGRRPSVYKASLQLVAYLLDSTPYSVKNTAALGTIGKRPKRPRRKAKTATPTKRRRRRRG